MFGIIHALFTGGVLAADGISKTWNNAGLREQARLKGDLWYTDYDNKTRLVANDRLVFITWNNDGDKIIKDQRNGHIYYNYTREREKEERKQDVEEALEKGKTIIRCSYNQIKRFKDREWFYDDRRCFVLYEDIETRKPVHVVDINKKYFIMDLTTGKLLREAVGDEWVYSSALHTIDCRVKYNDYTSEEIIEIFNKRQEKVDKEKLKKDKVMHYYNLRQWYYLEHVHAYLVDDYVCILDANDIEQGIYKGE